jgi:hypothetical protein
VSGSLTASHRRISVGHVEQVGQVGQGADMKAKKTNNPKKNGTLRPWLVDVVVDNLR